MAFKKSYERICKVCGKTFVSNYYNTKYCDECVANLKIGDLHRQNCLTRPKDHLCKYCGKPISGSWRVKYCSEHADSKNRLLKSYNTCKICGKLFHPTEARPYAFTCCRKCQGFWVQNYKCNFKKNKEDLKQLIFEYYKNNGYKNSSIVIKNLHISQNVLKKNNLLLLDIAKEVGVTVNIRRTSLFEDEIYAVLVKNFKTEIKRQVRNPFCRDKLPLPFDFYLPEYDLYIETDGNQHFHKNAQKSYFDDTRLHDSIKNKFCLDNKHYLLRIRYKRVIDINKLVNSIKSLLLQIEKSEANYLNCWDGSNWIPISSQASYIEDDEGSTTISKESTLKQVEMGSSFN